MGVVKGSNGAWLNEHLQGFAHLAHRYVFFRNLTTQESHHERAKNLFFYGSAIPAQDSTYLPVMFAKGASKKGLLPLAVEMGEEKWHVWASIDSEISILSVPGAPGLNLLNREAPEGIGDPPGVSESGLWKHRFFSPPISFCNSQPPFLQNCRLAVRLLEMGVPSVVLRLSGWDTHWGARERLMQRQLPLLDKGLCIITQELIQSGLWAETLVACVTEFGRTPILNQRCPPGRDHWTQAFPALLGGGGLSEGVVIGETDEFGQFIVGEALSIVDFRALVLQILGIEKDNLEVMPIAKSLTSRGTQG